jgi:hydroxymethylglutaryl-CoA lyase
LKLLPKKKYVKIIECPRDAMQGLHDFIDTNHKIKYINQLLKVGFDTLDFGSFVSPKAIPQMRDTAEVLAGLDLDRTGTKLLAIVANERGANTAACHPEIQYLGYPFSISETFQLRNTNATIKESVERVKVIQDICLKSGKELVIYISMGFGNPYGDTWNVDIVQHWVEELALIGINIFQLSDTVGVAKPESIAYLFSELIPPNPNVEFGAHFHTTMDTWEEKVEAAYLNGCLRYDGTIRGIGGCPMAQNNLVGNMPSEFLLEYMNRMGLNHDLNKEEYLKAMQLAADIF